MAYTPPYLHAVTRKENGLFAKLRAVSILLRINVLHTQKKVSLFTKKLAKKLARFKNTYYLCKRKITTNVAYSFFELIVYLYR
nr:MAG TPA: hypothetical protein [Caudoviricetes sp.]